MQYTLINPITGFHPIFTKEVIAEFLYDHLDNYGDPIEEIENAIDYALDQNLPGSGFIIVGHDDKKVTGTVVVNETGMKGYIPENILVYIATHGVYRGKGIGKELMSQAIKFSKGDIALHVEKDNPARFLYEKMGFTNPYLEMRLKKQA